MLSSRRRRSTAVPSHLAPRAAPASFSPGPWRTSAALRTTLDRRPIAAARYRAWRGGSRRARPATARCSCAGPWRRRATTSTQWTANGRLPAGDSSQDTAVVSRGVGHAPVGYRPGDLVFFGVDDGPTGHVALSLGNGQIVHCSSSGGGSNIRPLAGYVAPTGWIRWKAVSG